MECLFVKIDRNINFKRNKKWLYRFKRATNIKLLNRIRTINSHAFEVHGCFVLKKVSLMTIACEWKADYLVYGIKAKMLPISVFFKARKL